MILYYCLITKVGLVLADSTVFSWAGCHSWYQSDCMHQISVNNLNHWFWIKIAKIGCVYKLRWSVKDMLDREALEEIFGSFRWLINLWFILLTSSTFTLCQTYFLHNQTRWATCFIRVLCRITGIARVDGVIHSTDPIFASGFKLCSPCVSYMSIPHVECARQGYTPFKRRVSKVGRCPCSGLTHGCRFYSER
jgi:hypothetical protein